jgi:CTP:phosphocholine cytidylyltransferase-like protein
MKSSYGVIKTTMPATELLCNLIGISSSSLSREETLLIEADLYARVYKELTSLFRSLHSSYFQLMKFTQEMEETMLEETLARCVINDILSSEEYTLSGIAYYTQTPEDIVYDLAIGQNTCPSAKLLRRIIELHRSVRPTLYDEIFKKISNKPLNNLS